MRKRSQCLLTLKTASITGNEKAHKSSPINNEEVNKVTGDTLQILGLSQGRTILNILRVVHLPLLHLD